MVVSSAATAKLSTTTSTLENDKLVNLICHLSSPLQVSINIIPPPKKKKGAAATTTTPAALQLEVSNNIVLTHRNAILRSLSGMALHNTLDLSHQLLGGHSCEMASSPNCVLASWGGITSWMSVADTIRSSSSSSDDNPSRKVTLEGLESHLETRSFLIASSCGPTLADLDLYLAIRESVLENDDDDLTLGPNVSRWYEQCMVSMDSLAQSLPKRDTLPMLSVPLDASRMSPAVVPMFFYGKEGEDAIVVSDPLGSVTPSDTQARSAAAAAAAAGANTATATATAGGGAQLTEEQKKAAAEKRAKKKEAKKKKGGGEGGNKAKAAASNKKGGGGGASTELNISALDIRVGKILKAWNHETADKLYCEEVDVGESSGPRNIASGLRPFYTMDQMQNRRVLVLCNLKARKLVGFASHGMVLCASNADHTKVEFVVPPEGAEVGERVFFEGFKDGEPEAENKVAKKKIFEKLAPDLRTNGEGVVVWKGALSVTSGGSCVAENAMKDAQVA